MNITFLGGGNEIGASSAIEVALESLPADLPLLRQPTIRLELGISIMRL
jgi:hypothetical protein